MGWRPHAEDQMDDRGVTHEEVWTCLKKGQAYGPEQIDGELRANVEHAGIHVRVVVACLNVEDGDLTQLQELDVVTVIRTK